MWVFIEPFDVWMFRDGKPFAAGEQSRATGLFPPLPTTFQGVIRSAGLARELGRAHRSFPDFNAAQRRQGSVPDPLVDRWGRGAAHFGRFRMRGPFLARERGGKHEVLLPAPRDLLARSAFALGADPAARVFVTMRARALDDERILRGGLAAVSGARKPSAEAPDDPLESSRWPRTPHALEVSQPAADAPHEVGEGPAFLPADTFARYLTGEIDGTQVGTQDCDVFSDLRIGIQRDSRSGTVEHGRLYLAHFQRPDAGVGLAAEVWFAGESPAAGEPESVSADSPLPDTGVLGIGGEARAGRYRNLETSPLAPIENESLRLALRQRLGDARFKIVLVTPAVFSGGWCPGFISLSSLEGILAGVKVRLVAAVVGKPWPITGWDHASPRPKRLDWAAPPGSTYTFEVVDGNGDWKSRLLDSVHGRSIVTDAAGNLDESAAIGTGLAFVSVA